MSTLAATSTLTAATNSHPLAALVAVFLLAVLVAVPAYLAVCWLFPFVACPSCDGTGKRRSPFGRGFRWCSRCDGTGGRIRTGRHILNYLRRSHKASR